MTPAARITIVGNCARASAGVITESAPWPPLPPPQGLHVRIASAAPQDGQQRLPGCLRHKFSVTTCPARKLQTLLAAAFAVIVLSRYCHQFTMTSATLPSCERKCHWTHSRPAESWDFVTDLERHRISVLRSGEQYIHVKVALPSLHNAGWIKTQNLLGRRKLIEAQPAKTHSGAAGVVAGIFAGVRAPRPQPLAGFFRRKLMVAAVPTS